MTCRYCSSRVLQSGGPHHSIALIRMWHTELAGWHNSTYSTTAFIHTCHTQRSRRTDQTPLSQKPNQPRYQALQSHASLHQPAKHRLCSPKCADSAAPNALTPQLPAAVAHLLTLLTGGSTHATLAGCSDHTWKFEHQHNPAHTQAGSDSMEVAGLSKPSAHTTKYSRHN